MMTVPNVSIGDREAALAGEILRTVCGSGVHGMAIPGTDDHDEMGVYIERPSQVLGIEPSSEHYVSRTKPEGVRSEAGDTDLVIYSLRKYLRLATAGNPTVLTVLYAPDESILLETGLGEELRSLAPSIVSLRAVEKFLGYLGGQRERMVGQGKQSRVPKRPELVEAHGYDTKYASHAVRLGFQGAQLAQSGRLTLPLDGDALEMSMAVKRGEVGFEGALGIIDGVRDRLRAMLDDYRGPLRAEPDLARVNAWACEAHLEAWRRRPPRTTRLPGGPAGPRER